MEDQDRCFDHAERISSLESWIKVNAGISAIGYIGIIITLITVVKPAVA